MGLLAAAVFMLAVLPILLKAKEDQVNEDEDEDMMIIR